jgi:hypothetical protein
LAQVCHFGSSLLSTSFPPRHSFRSIAGDTETSCPAYTVRPCSHNEKVHLPLQRLP